MTGAMEDVAQPAADTQYGVEEATRSTRLHKLRAAICVVGQVARTEIESKIENLIEANMANADMHVFLVLQEGEGRFTNDKGAKTCEIAPTSLYDAVSRFAPYVKTTGIAHNFQPYDVHADAWPGFPLSGTEKASRLQNYINQFLTWRTCAEEVARHELENNMQFHVVLRLRDNSMVVRPFNLLDRLVTMEQRLFRQRQNSSPGISYRSVPVLKDSMLMNLPVVSKQCASWNGVNDKAMIVPRMHMDKALRSPADQFYLWVANQTQPKRIKNTEMYVKRILDTMNVPQYVEEWPRAFPITDARCEDGKSFCVVAQQKDCRPQELLTRFGQVKECKADYTDQAWNWDVMKKWKWQQNNSRR